MLSQGKAALDEEALIESCKKATADLKTFLESVRDVDKKLFPCDPSKISMLHSLSVHNFESEIADLKQIGGTETTIAELESAIEAVSAWACARGETTFSNLRSFIDPLWRQEELVVKHSQKDEDLLASLDGARALSCKAPRFV